MPIRHDGAAMRLKQLALVAVAILLASCASTSQSTTGVVDIAPGVTLSLPERPPFGPEANVIQLGQAKYQDREVVFQAVISSRPDAMNLVMTLPSGPRVMSFAWTPGSLQTRLEPIAPKGLSADHMLADMLVMYAPADLVRPLLSGAEFVAAPDGSRRIVRGDEVIVVVTRPTGSTDNLWVGKTVLENRVFGYTLRIEGKSSQQ
jgi:hypothetical protein